MTMKVVWWIAAFLLAFLLYVKYIERNSVYFPSKQVYALPDSLGLEYKEAYFDTRDLKRLHGWFVPKRGAESTILYAHGNAGNIADRLGKIALFNDWGFNVFIFDYRGYGKSTGRPFEGGLYPFSFGEELYKAAKEPKRLLKARGSHNEAFFESSPEVRDEIKSFISKQE